jgi:hypothetical protein
MSIYSNKLLELLPSSKYLHTYTKICSLAHDRAITRKQAKLQLGYVEGHHILPKSFKYGGEKDKSNYVYLTAREHFICHKLLVFATKYTRFYYPASAALAGFMRSSSFQQRPILTSHNYHFVRRCISISKKELQTGRKMSDATKSRMSVAQFKHHKLNPRTKQQCQNISKGRTGIKVSKEGCLAISLGKLGSIPWNKGLFINNLTKMKISKNRTGIKPSKMKCIYCDVIAAPNMLARFHNERCKLRNLT